MAKIENRFIDCMGIKRPFRMSLAAFIQFERMTACKADKVQDYLMEHGLNGQIQLLFCGFCAGALNTATAIDFTEADVLRWADDDSDFLQEALGIASGDIDTTQAYAPVLDGAAPNVPAPTA